MCFTDDMYPSVFSETFPRARRDHRECGETIPKGTRYRSVFGVWDGEAASFKICDACEKLRDRIVEHELAEGCHEDEATCPFGELAEYLANRHELRTEGAERRSVAELRAVFMALPITRADEVRA